MMRMVAFRVAPDKSLAYDRDVRGTVFGSPLLTSLHSHTGVLLGIHIAVAGDYSTVSIKQKPQSTGMLLSASLTHIMACLDQHMSPWILETV